MNGVKLEESIKQHEGKSLRAYQDSVGVWTAGYGRNLQAMTVTQECADNWLAEDVYASHQEAKKFPEYTFLDTDARQNAFIEMVFNLGATRLRGFTHMLQYIQFKNWDRVSEEMLASRWAGQVGHRAQVLAAMMRTGEFPQ